MATKMSIIDEIKKSFSRYLKDNVYVPRHVWLDPYFDTDEIHNNDTTINNPLNGLNSVDYSQTKTSDETIETNENKIELCFDRQNKDDIVDEIENQKSQEKSLKEEIDKTSAQQSVNSTDKSSKLLQLLESQNKGAKVFVDSRVKRSKKSSKSQEQLPNHIKKKSATKRKKDANANKKSDNVVEPLTPLNPLQRVEQNEFVVELTAGAPPTTTQQNIADDLSFIKSALELPDTLVEEKTLSINEWLQASSEAQLDNIMDEVDFDSFLLARYTEQTADESRISSSSVLPFSQPLQPLDLSVKQTTPLSTGFCNENGLLNTTPQFNHEIASKSEDAVHDLSQPLDLSMKQTAPMLTGFCNENFLMHSAPQQLNDEIASQSVNDFSHPIDLSVKQTTPMSTDTGFCDESFLLDSTLPYHSRINGVQTIQSNKADGNGSVVDGNDWINNNGNSTGSGNDNKTDKNCNLIEIGEMNENMEMLMQTPSANVEPIPSTLQTNRRESLQPVDSSPTMQHDDSTKKVTLTATESPMIQECIFESQQLPMWNTDYSTDLDYEPDEDE